MIGFKACLTLGAGVVQPLPVRFMPKPAHGTFTQNPP